MAIMYPTSLQLWKMYLCLLKAFYDTAVQTEVCMFGGATAKEGCSSSDNTIPAFSVSVFLVSAFEFGDFD